MVTKVLLKTGYEKPGMININGWLKLNISGVTKAIHKAIINNIYMFKKTEFNENNLYNNIFKYILGLF